MRKNIEELINSDLSAYRVSKETGITLSVIQKIFGGTSKLDNISLKNAEILSAYWEDIKMSKLTLKNLEGTFEKVVDLIGEDLQNTSTYLMRADSVNEAAEELGITTTEFLDKLDKPDYAKLIDYSGPIVWADYNKEDFYVLINTDDDSIKDFCDKVLAL